MLDQIHTGGFVNMIPYTVLAREPSAAKVT